MNLSSRTEQEKYECSFGLDNLMQCVARVAEVIKDIQGQLPK